MAKRTVSILSLLVSAGILSAWAPNPCGAESAEIGQVSPRARPVPKGQVTRPPRANPEAERAEPPRTERPAPSAQHQAPKKRGGLFRLLDSVSQTFRRLGKQLNSDLNVTGEWRTGWHSESISGTRDAYYNDRYYGRPLGGGYNQTDLTVQGKIAGIINFQTRYSNSLYGNPHENRLSLNYANRYFKIDAGDITGSIVGNSLIDFSRTLQGVQLSANVMRGLRFTTLFSQTKAQARTITINGGNGPGPYYVYAGQIVDGTERIRINDRDVPKEDYTLDLFTGELRFKPGTIINELDVISVTFEVYGYNQPSGLLTGFRTDIDLLKGAKMGLAYLSQSSGRRGSGLQYKEDQFYGHIDPLDPYILDYPVEMIVERDSAGNITKALPRYPMTITVNSIPQVYDIDYFVPPLTPNRVYFRRSIPETNIVKIRYVPATGSETLGSRSVFGVDTAFALGRYGSIVAEMANSSLGLSGQKVGGGAWQLRGDMKFLNDKLRWNWSLRDISANFTSIESPGFRRNESGFTMGFDYMASPNLKLNATLEKTKRPSYDFSSLSGGYGRARGRDDFSMLNFGASWQLGGAGQVNLTHNSMETRLFGGGKSSFVTDNLSFNYRLRSLNFDVSFGRNVNQSVFSTTTGGGAAFQQYNSDSLFSRLNMTWAPHERLSLNATFANSQSKAAQGRSNNAQDMALTAIFSPLRNMKFTLGYQNQNSGSYSVFGSTTGTGARALGARQVGGTGGTYGYGSGYGSYIGGYGNYSGGFNNANYYGYGAYNFGGKSRGVTMGMDYQPWQNLNLSLGWNSYSSEGDYQYNSRRNDLSFNLAYNLGERLSFNTAFSRQKVDYIGSAGGTNSNLLYFNIHAKPFGRLTADLRYQMMKTDSSLNLNGGSGSGQGTAFYGTGGMNLNGYGLRLEYPVWRGNSLFLQWDNDTSTGYLAADRRTWMIGFNFPLLNNMVFSVGWRNEENISRDTTGGNYSYRARSLDADLSVRF